MRNQPGPTWLTRDGASFARRDDRAAPVGRLLALFLAITVPLVAIAGRLTHVQLARQAAYLEPFAMVRHVERELPARHGRILAADGTVLADDLPTYSLAVHYRWIEDPIDPRWLRRKAWERLTRGERRQTAAVAVAEQSIREERERLWDELSRLTGTTREEFAARRREIQIRVERIWEDVEARRRAEETAASVPPTPTETGPLLRLRDTLVHELTQPPDRRVREPLVIAEQETEHELLPAISAEVATTLIAHPERYPGVNTRVRTRRIYPHRNLAAHLLGARTTLPEGEREPGGPVSRGRTGLERQYEAVLQGKPGRQRQVINRHGEVIATETITAAEHGRDLVLTLDLALQAKAEGLLDRALEGRSRAGEDTAPTEETATPPSPPQGGCLVALDVHTGAVLAAAAAPRFDANLLVASDPQAWSALARDPRKPFFPRLTHMALPPGSVFKGVTAVALLEAGVFTPDETIACRGYLDEPERHRCLIFRHHGVGHYDTDLAKALGQSCNVYFFTGARRCGPQPIVDWARRFGLGTPTGIDLPGETAGTLPDPQRPGTLGGRKRWYPGDTLGLAIGQSTLTTTPLQLARMMAAIANGGSLVTPHLASAGGPMTVDPSASPHVRPVFAHPEPQPINGLSPETLAAVRMGLTGVVHEPGGTGYKTIRLETVTIAGKTGTAETGGGRPDHAWFVGYAPAEEPRVAFAVVLEHGGSGSQAAGPLAREFVSSLLELGLITPPTSLADTE